MKEGLAAAVAEFGARTEGPMGYGTVQGCRGNLRRVLPQARLVGAQEGLLAAGHLQLAQDVRHVIRDRLRAERQSLRDLGVGGTSGHQVQKLALARPQRREGFLWRRGPRSREEGNHP